MIYYIYIWMFVFIEGIPLDHSISETVPKQPRKVGSTMVSRFAFVFAACFCFHSVLAHAARFPSEDRQQVSAESAIGTIMMSARIVPSFRNGGPSGFKLFSIKPGSDLDKVGLRNGDVVMQVNRISVNSPDDAVKAYENVKKLNTLTLTILRRGQEQSLVVNLADYRQK